MPLKNKFEVQIGDTKLLVAKKSIVTESLADEIIEYFKVSLGRNSFMEARVAYDMRLDMIRNDLLMLLEDFHMKCIINDQYDVICDARNNDRDNEAAGAVDVVVKYTQWNCVNASRIEFRLEGKEPGEIKKKKKGRIVL